MSNILPFQAKYFAYELTKQSPSNSLQKLAGVMLDAQVDINPHQVEAALFAFKSPLSKGAILADEVGLGKTIEAGLVISQKWVEKKRKILIIAPANLRKQWSQELKDKFFLDSVVLEKSSFDSALKSGNLNPFNNSNIVICSYQFASQKAIYLELINWDLVVIDEAHRLRNVYKPNNKIAISIKKALDHAPKILLTATPLQNSLLELYGLVSIIDDYAFGDLKSFTTQYNNNLNGEDVFQDLRARLQPICKRTLRRQVLEYVKYTNRKAIVEEYYPTEEEKILYDRVSAYLQQDHLNALPASQRKLMTLILRKLLASSSYAIAATFQNLAHRLEQQLQSDFEADHSELQDKINTDIGTDFEELEEKLDEWSDEESYIGNIKTLDKELQVSIANEIVELRELELLAKAIKQNSKGEKLITALDRAFDELKRLGALQKAIIFTESRKTQDYVYNLLDQHGYKDRIVLFNGTNSDIQSRKIYKDWLHKHQGTDAVSGAKAVDIRAALVDYFKNEAVIMIATEAAAEGINLQFCSLIVNYDMPWNPQRIEQRIGRCHRYGQKHDVVVLNFLNKSNAADQRVYNLLDKKFQLFSGVFGASDDVLGAIESGVDFEKRIAAIYQECRDLIEIETAFEKLQEELEEQITEKLQHTRQQLLENFDVEVHKKLKINLEESTQYINQYEQWLWSITEFALFEKASFYPGYEFAVNDGKNIVKYKITKDTEGDFHHYRISHPLAQKIISECKALAINYEDVCFHYSQQDKKITALQNLIGCIGIMEARIISIDSFEQQDFIFVHAILRDQQNIEHSLDNETCQNMLSTLKTSYDHNISLNDFDEMKLAQLFEADLENVKYSIQQCNNSFFDQESDKLDKWAEDLKLSLEKQIKDLDLEIKMLKSNLKKILILEDKIKEKRKINDLEKKRIEKRRDLFTAQDDIDRSKDEFLKNIEQRLHQKDSCETIFKIKFIVR